MSSNDQTQLGLAADADGDGQAGPVQQPDGDDDARRTREQNASDTQGTAGDEVTTTQPASQPGGGERDFSMLKPVEGVPTESAEPALSPGPGEPVQTTGEPVDDGGEPTAGDTTTADQDTDAPGDDAGEVDSLTAVGPSAEPDTGPEPAPGEPSVSDVENATEAGATTAGDNPLATDDAPSDGPVSEGRPGPTDITPNDIPDEQEATLIEQQGVEGGDVAEVTPVGPDAFKVTFEDGETKRVATSDAGVSYFQNVAEEKAAEQFEQQLSSEGYDVEVTEDDVYRTEGGYALDSSVEEELAAEQIEASLEQQGLDVVVTADDVTIADGGGYKLTDDAAEEFGSLWPDAPVAGGTTPSMVTDTFTGAPGSGPKTTTLSGGFGTGVEPTETVNVEQADIAGLTAGSTAKTVAEEFLENNRSEFRQEAANKLESKLEAKGIDVDLAGEDVRLEATESGYRATLTDAAEEDVEFALKDAGRPEDVNVANDFLDAVGDATEAVTDPTGEFLGDLFGDDTVGDATAIASLPAIPFVAGAKFGADVIDETATEAFEVGGDIRRTYFETASPYREDFKQTVRQPVVETEFAETIATGTTDIRTSVLDATTVDETLAETQRDIRTEVVETGDELVDDASGVLTGAAVAATTYPEPITTAAGVTVLGGAALLATADPLSEKPEGIQPTYIPIPDEMAGEGRGEIAIPDTFDEGATGELEVPDTFGDESTGELEVPDTFDEQADGEIAIPDTFDEGAEPGIIRVGQQPTLIGELEEDELDEDTESDFEEPTGSDPDVLREIFDIGDGTTLGEEFVREYEPEVLRDHTPVRTFGPEKSEGKLTEADMLREEAEQPQVTGEATLPPGETELLGVGLAEDVGADVLTDADADTDVLSALALDRDQQLALTGALPQQDVRSMQAVEQQVDQQYLERQYLEETVEYPPPVGYPPEYPTVEVTEEVSGEGAVTLPGIDLSVEERFDLDEKDERRRWFDGLGFDPFDREFSADVTAPEAVLSGEAVGDLLEPIEDP